VEFEATKSIEYYAPATTITNASQFFELINDILSPQQPIFPHQLPLNINSSNLSMRRPNALDLGNDLSSPTMSPKSEVMSTLQNKIARIEHEIIS
jgi:hypothetical protein